MYVYIYIYIHRRPGRRIISLQGSEDELKNAYLHVTAPPPAMYNVMQHNKYGCNNNDNNTNNNSDINITNVTVIITMIIIITITCIYIYIYIYINLHVTAPPPASIDRQLSYLPYSALSADSVKYIFPFLACKSSPTQPQIYFRGG